MRRHLLAVTVVATLVILPISVLAAHRFGDVPDSNIFHDDIDWLADSGVTVGCNPPANDAFCPSDNVTREQMAAFLHRLADNQVVDAGRLQGMTAAELLSMVDSSPAPTPVLSYAVEEGRSFPDGEFTAFTAATVEVDAPSGTAGAALAEAVGKFLGDPGVVAENRDLACWIATEADSVDSFAGAVVGYRPGEPVTAASFATSHAVALSAGESVTFYLRCRDLSGGAGNRFRVAGPRLSALFVPGDGHTIAEHSEGGPLP